MLKISTAFLELTYLNGAVNTCEGTMLGLGVVISKPNRLKDKNTHYVGIPESCFLGKEKVNNLPEAAKVRHVRKVFPHHREKPVGTYVLIDRQQGG